MCSSILAPDGLMQGNSRSSGAGGGPATVRQQPRGIALAALLASFFAALVAIAVPAAAAATYSYDGGRHMLLRTHEFAGFGFASAVAAVDELTSVAATGFAAEDAEGGLTRVGRWMSPEEHQAMVDTGMVQPGRVSPQVSVAHPADVEAYMRQAAPGTRYVEFDVPETSVVQGGKEGWAIIPGPESIYSRLAASRGLPPFELPPALNIEWLASRVAP